MASHQPASTRREFLRKQAGQTFLAALGLRGRVESPSREQGELVSLSRTAMACRFEIALPAEDEAALEAAQQALDLVDRLEQQMTVFRDTSEISDINRRAASQAVPVEPGLFELLQLAERLATETDGAFDITAGPLNRVWALCRREARLPGTEELKGAVERVGMRHVRLDNSRGTIEFTRGEVELNLGAIGKGYALDRVADLLRSKGVENALVHAGQSSVLAMGSPPWERDWIVSVSHPEGAGRSVAAVRLRDRSMSTSASSQQFLEIAGRRYGHIIDPRTGWPADGIMSATAIASTAAEADALSTAFFILGVPGARAYCEGHPEVRALLVCEGEPDCRPTVLNIGIPEESPEGTA